MRVTQRLVAHRVVRPDLPPALFGEAGEREQIRPGGIQLRDDRWELAGDGIHRPVILGVHGRGVGLVIDRLQQRLTHGQVAFRVADIRLAA